MLPVWCLIEMDIKTRGKKITCPGARDKLNFRQDKQIFSPNVRRTNKKFNACLSFPLTRINYLVTGQVQILMYLPGGQVNIFRFFYPWKPKINPLSAFCDLMPCHVLCLQHGFPVKHNSDQSNTVVIWPQVLKQR